MSGLSEQRKLEEEAASHLEGSAESKEAFSAFMEKRQPKLNSDHYIKDFFTIREINCYRRSF